MGRPTKRKLLKRSDVPLELWGNLLVAATVAGTGLFFLLISIFRGGDVVSFLFSLVLVVASAPVVVSLWRVLGRKIVFLDKYISYTGWLGSPKTYRYEDIVDVQKVDIPLGRSAWWIPWTGWEFEDNVTILFADGERLKIPTSAMKPREVQRRIESKTGLRFDTTLKI